MTGIFDIFDKFKGELKAKINYFFLEAKGMNINVLSLFCTYWPAFPLKKILFAAFVAQNHAISGYFCNL